MIDIIVNADDCGYSKKINQHIEHFIQCKKISSTTIMANMDDFDGAIELYKKYGDTISFGIHLNLTEGEPLLYSKDLIDSGVIIEKDGKYVFEGHFPYYIASQKVLRAVHVELSAQIRKILNAGITPTHIDSHHFVHTFPSLITLVPTLMEEAGVTKVRRMRNYVPNRFQRFIRSMWLHLIKKRNTQSTDFFASFTELWNNPIDVSVKSIELMCHPGGRLFEDEEHFMEKINYPPNTRLISYHDNL